MNVLPMPVGELRPKVLIADDERAIARTLEAVLQQSGFVASAVNDGRTAIEKAGVWRPDILLTDIMMPGLDGFAVAEAIHAKFPGCHIFLLSAQLEAAKKVRSYWELGYPFHFIAKPVHPRELVRRLREALGPEKSEMGQLLHFPGQRPL